MGAKIEAFYKLSVQVPPDPFAFGGLLGWGHSQAQITQRIQIYMSEMESKFLFIGLSTPIGVIWTVCKQRKRIKSPFVFIMTWTSTMTSATPHDQASVEFSSQDATKVSEPDMPVQRHAGKVGYGPNYHAGPVSPSISPIKLYSSPFSPFI